MLLSPAERAYLYDSLALAPPVRPDGRKAFQMRLLEARTNFLPSSNGSSRVRFADGSECIVSVKSKVVPLAKEPNLVLCDIDVLGFRDDSNFVANLKYSLTDLFVRNFPAHKLHLTKKYAFKLFVDCIVTLHSSYPLLMVTLATYLALKTTRLPLLTSEVDDEEVEEQPTFSDDWESSLFLATMVKEAFQPPLFITLGVVGDTIIAEPSLEEEQVLDNGLLIGWCNGSAIAPVSNLNLATNSNNTNFVGIPAKTAVAALKLASKVGPKLVEALDGLIADEEEGDATMF